MDPSNPLANVSENNQNANSSSKVEIGHVVSTSSSDSVFVLNEQAAPDTDTKENVIETPQAQNAPLDEKSVVNEEPVKSEPNEAPEPERKEVEASDEVPSEQSGVAAVEPEEKEARPPSNTSRNDIDECNSVSQLPKAIVRKSINAAVNRLSLPKEPSGEDDDVEANKVQGTQPEAVLQENQMSESPQQESEQMGDNEKGENKKENQSDEGQVTDAQEPKDTNDGEDVTNESQKGQAEETEPPVAASTQCGEGNTTEEVPESSSKTNAAVNEGSSNDQESPTTNEESNDQEPCDVNEDGQQPPVANEDSSDNQQPPAAVDASGEVEVDKDAPQDVPAAEQEASTSASGAENNTGIDDQATIGENSPQ